MNGDYIPLHLHLVITSSLGHSLAGTSQEDLAHLFIPSDSVNRSKVSSAF